MDVSHKKSADEI